jgi:signal transduction histidine kinase
MHDGLVQFITAARYELQAAKVATESASTATTQERLQAAQEVLGEIEREVRHAIYDLTPPVLNATGLVPALQKHVGHFQKLSGINSNVHLIGAPFRAQPAIERAVFRLAEEALQNVAAHAQAETASVILDFQPSMLRVVVQDQKLKRGRGIVWRPSRFS